MGDSPKKVYLLLVSGVFECTTRWAISRSIPGATRSSRRRRLYSPAWLWRWRSKCGLLNIGAEGQLYGRVRRRLGRNHLHKFPRICSDPDGDDRRYGGWSGVGRDSGGAQAQFGSHEVINTIMMNFVAVGLVSYLTQRFYKEQGDPIMQTAPIADQARIARFSTLLAPFGVDFPQRIPLNVSFCSPSSRLFWSGSFYGGRNGGMRFAPSAQILRRRNTAASACGNRSCWRWRCRARWREWSA